MPNTCKDIMLCPMSIALAGAKCPLCSTELISDEHLPLIKCARCGALYHQDCWEFCKKKCSIYGCRKSRQRALAGVRQPRAPSLSGGVGLAAYLFGWLFATHCLFSIFPFLFAVLCQTLSLALAAEIWTLFEPDQGFNAEQYLRMRRSRYLEEDEAVKSAAKNKLLLAQGDEGYVKCEDILE